MEEAAVAFVHKVGKRRFGILPQPMFACWMQYFTCDMNEIPGYFIMCMLDSERQEFLELRSKIMEADIQSQAKVTTN